MAAIARPKRRICEIKEALANLRADAKANEHCLDRKERKRFRSRELSLDVAQYLTEWMPGENRCQEAWLGLNNITAEELQGERPIPLSTTCAENPIDFDAPSKAAVASTVNGN